MIRQMNPSHVTLTGGEPFMRRDLLEIVDFLHDRKITINLISNGSLISDAVVAQYRGKIQVWELPLLSHRREIHDRLGGAGKVFDRVTYAVAALKAAGQTVVVVFVDTKRSARATAKPLRKFATATPVPSNPSCKPISSRRGGDSRSRRFNFGFRIEMQVSAR